jgi:hypothetical protein
MSAAVNDATSALLRALRAMLEHSARFVVEEVRSRSWASVTFAGARHELAFRLEGHGAEAAAARFVADLEAAEFPLRGHIVADIALVSEERRQGCARLRIEALTVEDD